MHPLDIPLDPRVETHRTKARAEFTAALATLTRWLTMDAILLPLHRAVEGLVERFNALALSSLALWAALRLQAHVPSMRVVGNTSYSFQAWRREPVRTRFGVFHSLEPVYLRLRGKGPGRLFPHARRMGLSAGRMSLGVQLVVAGLVARMPFEAVRQVADTVGLWVPGKRAMLGVVDLVGPAAISTMHNPVTPANDTEGTHVILEQDDGGIPHVRPDELKKRRQPNKRCTRRGLLTRMEKRRLRRGRRIDRRRREKGDKSKNCRMATVYVLYTLKVHPDGTVEGPLNRQVFAATTSKAKLRKTVLRAAKARGWGQKPSIYLADGAASHWKAWKKTFKEGTPCLDWFHVAQYLWDGADAAFKFGGVAPKGKRAKTNYNRRKRKVQVDKSKWVRARQDELLSGDVDKVLQEIRKLGDQVARTGPGTRSRRKAIASAMTYLENHRDYLTYSEVGHIIMGTGNVEGTIKQLGARMKGPGMRWSVERAERVLALRCLQLSNSWDKLVSQVQRRHEALTSLHVPAISPSAILTAHKSARKAA